MQCIFKNILFLYLDLSCGMQDLVPQPGIEPGPLHWELGVSAPGPPEKPPSSASQAHSGRERSKGPAQLWVCPPSRSSSATGTPRTAGFTLASTLSSRARHSRCLPGSNLSKGLSVCPSSRVQGPSNPEAQQEVILQAACTRPSSLALETGHAC